MPCIASTGEYGCIAQAAVYDFDFDASGHHLLYAWDTLFRWIDGRSVKVADGINAADW
jgi:hypothetical protein